MVSVAAGSTEPAWQGTIEAHLSRPADQRKVAAMSRFPGSVFALFLLVCTHAPANAATWLVKPDGTGAALTIQDGVNVSANGDTVLLAPGTYTGAGNRDVNFNGKAIVVTSQSGAAATIIDCQGLGRGFIFTSGESATSVLSHVTITNGSATEGGAIYAHVAKPTITDNIIVKNSAADAGGGIFVYGASSNPSELARNTISGNSVLTGVAARRGGGIWSNSLAHVIVDNVISDNNADEGGGVWLGGSNSNELRGNVITNNTADTRGGGVYLPTYQPTVQGNTISGNYAGNHGGGIYTDNAVAVLEDCLITGNSVGLLGAGVYARLGSPTLRNVTLAQNTGTGAIIVFGSSLTVERTIIAFNSGDAMLCFSGGAATVSCSDLYGNLSNTICGVNAGQNFSLDPLFCNAPGGDYHISAGSPATTGNSPCGLLVGALPPCDPTGIGDGPFRTVVLENFPNPFNPNTLIRYGFEPPGGHTTLAIYDVHGRRVRTLVNEYQPAGVHTVVWDGRDNAGMKVASGVYFYRLTAPGVEETRRMVLLK